MIYSTRARDGVRFEGNRKKDESVEIIIEVNNLPADKSRKIINRLIDATTLEMQRELGWKTNKTHV